MQLLGLALLGMVLGAAGTEFLRASKPELVKKIEDRIRLIVDASFSSSESSEEGTEKDSGRRRHE